MKIYIHPLPFEQSSSSLSSLLSLLSDLQIKVEYYTEIYTNESIYHVDSKHIYLLDPKDRETFVYKDYFNGISLVVDNSYFIKTLDTSIHGSEHIHNKIKKYTYALHPKSKLTFIMEVNEDTHCIKDVYFESDENINIKEVFIKQEIIEFLSLLN